VSRRKQSPVPLRFRRSRYVLAHWSGERLIFSHYGNGVTVEGEPELAAILHFFGTWRSVPDLLRRFPQFAPASLERAVDQLTKYKLLRRSTEPEPDMDRRLRTWGGWLPAAAWFHFSTKDIRYFDVEEADRFFRDKMRRVKPPPAIKRVLGRRYVLPQPQRDGEFASVLLGRRTWRQFGGGPVSLSSLSTLLNLTWGIQRWTDVPGTHPVPLKTSPSGGARHPIEVYAFVLGVAGLPRGLYHYRPDTYRLELISLGATRHRIRRYLPGQRWFADASILFIMTAVFGREQWRYETARAYRAVLMDAGHLGQTFCLVATWLGLAPFCTLAVADTRIETDLGIDGVTESVLYVTGVGPRPAGVLWAPLPDRKRATSRAGNVGSASFQRSRNS
jgi:SagB-type dehydrogenase family enzyme